MKEAGTAKCTLPKIVRVEHVEEKSSVICVTTCAALYLNMIAWSICIPTIVPTLRSTAKLGRSPYTAVDSH